MNDLEQAKLIGKFIQDFKVFTLDCLMMDEYLRLDTKNQSELDAIVSLLHKALDRYKTDLEIVSEFQSGGDLEE